MKLTENDYFTKDGNLTKGDGTTFSSVFDLYLHDKSTFQKNFSDSLKIDLLNRISFPASYSGDETDGFDECFLAELRNCLKEIEIDEVTVFISMDASELLNEKQDFAIELFYHTARRIKDCSSVAGFELPDASEDFNKRLIDTLQKKHPEYVYFTKNKDLFNSFNSIYPKRICFLS